MLAIGGTFLFALKSIFIKLAFDSGASPILLLAVRMMFAFPFYVFVLWRVSRSSQSVAPSRKQVFQTLILGFLGYYLASLLDLTGLQYISAQLERLTLFTYPAMVAVLAWMFLGERAGPKVILSILLGYAGILLMYGQERTVGETANSSLTNLETSPAAWGSTATGVLLVIASALSYSFYILFAKPAMQKMGSKRFTCLAMIGSTGFVSGHFALTSSLNEIATASPIIFVYGVVLAFVCTVLPSFMINEAIVRIGATRTTVIGTVGPVLTMLLAIGVLGEASSWQHFAGMIVATAGVSLVAIK